MEKFSREKADVLKKLKECDKSKIGRVDLEIRQLIDFLNKVSSGYEGDHMVFYIPEEFNRIDGESLYSIFITDI